MNFFCTKKHYEDWVAESGTDTSDLFILEVTEALVVARWLFGLE
jgi:hypothetical protein